MPEPPSITPEMRVGEFLDAFPSLEPVLVAQAPAFGNLRNPVLRRTVAKVATLAQAARIGGVDVRELVRTLRSAAGQPIEGEVQVRSGSDPGPLARPAWFADERVVARLDADAILARGEHPLGLAQQQARALVGDQLLCIDSGFVPEPLVDTFTRQGYDVAVFESAPGRFCTAIRARREQP